MHLGIGNSIHLLKRKPRTKWYKVSKGIKGVVSKIKAWIRL